MTKTKVQEVATAIFKAVRSGVSPYGDAWKDYEADARAAIEAMREPTEKMMEAADNATQGDDWHYIKGAWRAMIDAALAE